MEIAGAGMRLYAIGHQRTEGTVVPLRWWRCFECGLAYLHARLLATHRMKVHGEPRFDTIHVVTMEGSDA